MPFSWSNRGFILRHCNLVIANCVQKLKVISISLFNLFHKRFLRVVMRHWSYLFLLTYFILIFLKYLFFFLPTVLLKYLITSFCDFIFIITPLRWFNFFYLFGWIDFFMSFWTHFKHAPLWVYKRNLIRCFLNIFWGCFRFSLCECLTLWTFIRTLNLWKALKIYSGLRNCQSI